MTTIIVVALLASAVSIACSARAIYRAKIVRCSVMAAELDLCWRIGSDACRERASVDVAKRRFRALYPAATAAQLRSFLLGWAGFDREQ